MMTEYLNNQEKIEILNDRISALQELINITQQYILDYPDGDHPNKRPRSEILSEYIDKKNAMQAELDLLTNQA
jgi:hypothetical protein